MWDKKDFFHLEDRIDEEHLRETLCPDCDCLLTLLSCAGVPELLVCRECKSVWKLDRKEVVYGTRKLSPKEIEKEIDMRFWGG